MNCVKKPCRSPVACGGFGYCRELNAPHWFRYARHDDVPEWEKQGWSYHAELGLPHSHYACLMIWTGEDEPS